MSRFDVLIDGMHGQSCGLCCSKPYPCDPCLTATVTGNGFDIEVVEKVRGLRHVNHGSFDRWGFSELCLKLKELRKEADRIRKGDE